MPLIEEDPDGKVRVIGENFAGKLTPPAPFDDADVYERCNFSQPQGRTGGGQVPYRGLRIFPDAQFNSRGNRREYERCTMDNAEPWNTSEIRGGQGAVSLHEPQDLQIAIDGGSISQQRTYHVGYGQIAYGSDGIIPVPEANRTTELPSRGRGRG